MAAEWIGEWGEDSVCLRCVICGARVDPVILANRQDARRESRHRRVAQQVLSAT